MNGKLFMQACTYGAMGNRVRLMSESIQHGNSEAAAEHARWAAHMGMELMAERAGVKGWLAYKDVKEFWEFGNGLI